MHRVCRRMRRSLRPGLLVSLLEAPRQFTSDDLRKQAAGKNEKKQDLTALPFFLQMGGAEVS
jgi:hypothetical protein